MFTLKPKIEEKCFTESGPKSLINHKDPLMNDNGYVLIANIL